MAADLVIENCRVVAGLTDPAVPGGAVTISYTIANRGNVGSGPFHVAPVQSDTPVPSGLEEILFTRLYGSGLGAGQVFTDTVTYTPVYSEFFDGDDNTGHIAFIADAFNRVVENSESNNSGRGVGIDSISFRIDGHLDRSPSVGKLPTPSPLPANGIVDSAIGDELSGNRDIDVYGLDAVAGRFYEVDVDTTSFSGLDAVVRVYDPSFNLVASNDDGGYGPRTIDPYLQFAAGTAGRYFVVVSAKQNANADPRLLQGRTTGSTGTYSMLARQLSLPTVKLTTGPTAVEGDATRPARITVTRENGLIDRDLFVKWELLGTATTADLPISPDGVLIPAGQSSVTLTVVPTQDGIAEPLESLIINLRADQRYVRDPVQSTAVVFIADDPATDAPDVVNAFYAFNAAGGSRFVIEFDQAVNGFEAADLDVINLATGAAVRGFALVQTTPTTYALDFRFLASRTVPDGNYRVVLRAGTVTSGFGVGNAEQAASFFALGGDADRNRQVDIADFARLAGRFNAPGAFADGDFNYSGVVEIADFAILAANFNKSLPAPTASSAADGGGVQSPFGVRPIDAADRLADLV